MSADNVLVKHLQTLAQQESWNVRELPETITVNVLNVLGSRGWVEVRHWRGNPSRPVRTIPPAEYDKWISPVQYLPGKPGPPKLTTFEWESLEIRITEQGTTKLREAAVLAAGSIPESPKPLAERRVQQLDSDDDSPKGYKSSEGKRTLARHSPDFRSVYWYGSEYNFTATQAAIVKVLWEAWGQDTPDVSDAHLLTQAEATGDRLANVFRKPRGKGYHPAWNVMIVKGSTKGTTRLQLPE